VAAEPKYKSTGKIDVDDLYAAPTPAAYVQFLYEHDYRLPAHATPILRAVLAKLRALRGRKRLRVLDLGCSYGIMGAFLRHDLDLAALHRHYGRGYDTTRAPDEICRDDAGYFTASRRRNDLAIVGIDSSRPAVDYAMATGFIDEGCALSLEDETTLAGDIAGILSGLDLVFSTGVIGYAGVQTVRRLLALNGTTQPWLLNFVLRGVDYGPIAQFLAGEGYVTARDRNVYRQRKFAGEEERNRWLDNLRTQGIDAAGYEATGYSCAELFLSRPIAEAAGPPALAAVLL
jgi:SAM-dependent methyltransferase